MDPKRKKWNDRERERRTEWIRNEKSGTTETQRERERDTERELNGPERL